MPKHSNILHDFPGAILMSDISTTPPADASNSPTNERAGQGTPKDGKSNQRFPITTIDQYFEADEAPDNDQLDETTRNWAVPDNMKEDL